MVIEGDMIGDELLSIWLLLYKSKCGYEREVVEASSSFARCLFKASPHSKVKVYSVKQQMRSRKLKIMRILQNGFFKNRAEVRSSLQ